MYIKSRRKWRKTKFYYNVVTELKIRKYCLKNNDNLYHAYNKDNNKVSDN